MGRFRVRDVLAWQRRGLAVTAPLPLWLLWWRDFAEGALLCAGGLAAWALALYVTTRGGLRRVPVLTAAALSLLAVYLLGVGLATLTPEHPNWNVWLRNTFFSAAFVPAVWLVTALVLYVEEAPSARSGAGGDGTRTSAAWEALLPWLASGTLATGAIFAILGTFTDLVNVWSLSAEVPNAVPGGPALRRTTPQGTLFTAYEAYLLLCSGGALAVFLRLWRLSASGTSLRARFGWLSAAAVLFLAAGGALTVWGELFAFAGLPGHLMVVAGIAIMGWNVARYGALLKGEVVNQDFWAFATSMVGLVVVYGVLLVAIGSVEHGWLRRSVPLLVLLMGTHVLADTRSPLLERLLYGTVSGGLRWQLRSLAARVVRQPDLFAALAEVRETVDALLRGVPPPEQRSSGHSQPAAGDTERRRADAEGAVTTPDPGGPIAPLSELRHLVEGALRHLNDLPTLSRHDLLECAPNVSSGTALERAADLRRELEEAIARLAPAGPRPAPSAQAGTSGWLHFVVLHEAYVDGRPNKQVMQRYHLSEGTFHRARRRAIDALTQDLHERWTAPVSAG